MLLWIDRRWQLPRGSLMAVYVVGYGVGRLWVESLRIDPANELAGLRFNQWMAILAIVGGVGLHGVGDPPRWCDRRAPTRHGLRRRLPTRVADLSHRVVLGGLRSIPRSGAHGPVRGWAASSPTAP